MDNDELREKIAKYGITCQNVTDDQLVNLHNKLSESLELSDSFHGEYRMNPLTTHKFMTCNSDYFDSREAISFNSDGFIGFAGWSDSKNIIPIRLGVISWLEEMNASND